MRPFEIYRLKVAWRNCEDARPWIVVQTRPNATFGCFPISSQCYGQDCFPLDMSHPDFAFTGLTRSCFVICTTVYDLHEDQFSVDGTLQLKGELLGEFLRDFRKFAGV